MHNQGSGRWAEGSLRWIREVFFFGVVGLSATASYLAFSFSFALLGISATPASFMSYVLSTPFSYFGHRRFTFHSDVDHKTGIPRFTASLLIGLILSTSIPYTLNQVLGISDSVSFLVVAVAVPTVTFFVFKIYVFRR